jgi:hypothetical protein
MFDFRPENEDGERPQYYSSGDWGNLPGFDTLKISMVKIASSITQLEHGKGIREFVDTMRATNFELVATIRVQPQNYIVRREVCLE